jgi:transcriptional regulator with XRE-family HTH domain
MVGEHNNPTRWFMELEPRVVQKDDLKRRIASIVKSKRDKKKLTQAQLAEAANISRTSVAVIEAAKQECGLETFVNLALALGIEPHKLLEEVWRPVDVQDLFALKVLKESRR